MHNSAGTCSFTVDREDWEGWGGDGAGWPDFLDGLGVDGDIWECPHEAVDHDDVDGPERCVFHLSPQEVPDDIDESEYLRQAIEAEEIHQDKRRQRLKQFLGATFGRIELAEDPLDGNDNHPIILCGATFIETIVITIPVRNVVSVSLAKFDNGVDFRDATFEDVTNFEDAAFYGVADFRGTKFDDVAYFENVKFEQDAHFASATFDHEANFTQATFDGDADFIHVRFGDTALFDGATFANKAFFWKLRFDGDVIFGNATFNSEAAFWMTIFDGKANFWNAKFDGEADFRNTTFNDGARFLLANTSAEFPISPELFSEPPEFTAATLEDAEFNQIDLRGVDFRRTNLTDADFSNANLLGANLETATLSRANLFGADLRGAALAGAVLTDARIDDETRFLNPPVDDLPVWSHLPLFLARRFSGEPVLPTCGYDPEFTPQDEDEDIDYPDEDLDKAKSVYRAIENLAGLSSRPRLEGRAFVRRQDIQREQYRRSARKAKRQRDHLKRVINRGRSIRASFSRAIMLYGQSPWRVVGTALSVIVTFALLYPLGGWMQPTVCSADDPATSIVECAPLTYANDGIVDTLLVIGQSLYYSTLTFTTLGFGDFRPVGPGQALTTIETGLGAVLIALLVFVLGRRAAQ